MMLSILCDATYCSADFCCCLFYILVFFLCREYTDALDRLCVMTRGIGDPLVAIYARCYLCRVSKILILIFKGLPIPVLMINCSKWSMNITFLLY
jgi:hypothetical protein